MKRIGVIIIAIGCAFLAYALFVYFRGNQELVSPVPDSKGVKVIYITPGADSSEE